MHAKTGMMFLIAGLGVQFQSENLDPQPSVSTGNPSETADQDFFEVIYRGESIRVPVGPDGPSEVRLGQSNWNLKVSSANAETNSVPAGRQTEPPKVAAPTAAPGPFGLNLSMEMVVLSATLGAVVLGLLGYMFVIDPMRRRRPLREALAIIQQDRKPQFARAEELLDQSLLAGLRSKDIATARFALAFLRAQLNKFSESATVLGDLEKSGSRLDRATVYLMLYVNSKLQNHERVDRIYHQYEKLLKSFRQSEMIVSITWLALAELRWARREINGAMHYFNEVRRLGMLASEIPDHIDDHEVVVGVSSLFEKNIDEATKHFQAAITEAQSRGRPDFSGRIGLAICQWRNGERSNIDEELASILKQLQPSSAEDQGNPVRTKCPHCGRGYRVRASYAGKHVQCKGCRRRFEVPADGNEVLLPNSDEDNATADKADSEDQLLSDTDQLLRNVRLWHCVVRILTWQQLAPGSGLPENERKTLHRRLQQVIKVDASMGDPYLIDGLIDYYFARNDQERQRGREQIERSLKKDVHLPEILQLIEREQKLASLSENSLSYFHQLSRKYIENPEVDPQLRERFAQKMNRFERFRSMGVVGEETQTSVVPSLENLRGRGQILSTRVTNILRYRMSDASEELRGQIGERLGQMQERTKVLSETADSLQKTEFELMEHTGEFLFNDDVPTSGDTGRERSSQQ